MTLQRWYLVSYAYRTQGMQWGFENAYLSTKYGLTRKVIFQWLTDLMQQAGVTDVTILSITPLEYEPVPDIGSEETNAKQLTTEGATQVDTV